MPRLPKSLVKRGKSYVYRRLVPGPKGRKVSKRESLGTDRDLAIAELARRRSLKTGVTQEHASEVSVEEASKRWLSSYVPTHRGERGVRLATQRVRDYLVPLLGHFFVGRLSVEDLQAFRLQVENSAFPPWRRGKRERARVRPLSVQSVRHILSDCRCFLGWCKEVGLIERSPFPRRLLPPVQERLPDSLTAEALQRVCSVEEPYGFICRFLAQTGLRWGEFVRARTTDISGNVLAVHHQTKSGKVRRVPLTNSIREELCGRVGRISPLTDAHGFAKQVIRLSRVKPFHAHQLRHTFACRWLEAGGSLAALQEILGHASIVTTQRYGRLGEAHVQAEAERIGNKLVTPVVTPQLRRTS